MNKVVAVVSGLATGGAFCGGIAYFTIGNKQETKNTEVADPQRQKAYESKEITSHLEALGLEIPLKAADKERWNTQWGVFKKKYESVNDLPESWKLGTWTDLKNQADAPETFKEKCIENGKQKIDNPQGDLFTEVKTYCSIKKEGTSV